MIKINLVPVKEKKKRKEFVVIFCASLVFVVIFLGMFYFYVKRRAVVSDLNKQIEEVKKESEGYQDKINEIKDLQTKKDSLDAIKKTVKGISETQRKILVAVDQAAMNLPDGIWLARLEEGKGNDMNKFIIQGYSVSIPNLEKYFSSLQQPGGLIREVTYDEKNYSVAAGLTNQFQLHQFEISFKVPDPGT